MYNIGWIIGCAFGFEFIDNSFMGGGWSLHLGIIRITYISGVTLEEFDEEDEQ